MAWRPDLNGDRAIKCASELHYQHQRLAVSPHNQNRKIVKSIHHSLIAALKYGTIRSCSRPPRGPKGASNAPRNIFRYFIAAGVSQAIQYSTKWPPWPPHGVQIAPARAYYRRLHNARSSQKTNTLKHIVTP